MIYHDIMSWTKKRKEYYNFQEIDVHEEGEFLLVEIRVKLGLVFVVKLRLGTEIKSRIRVVGIK